MMAVETFECSETAAEPIEASEEASSLIEELGLSGQKKMLAKTKTGHDTRCPYREMTKDEQFVYGVLCPERVALNSYDAAPIPLRILQVAAHAQSLGMFKHLYVWDKASQVVKDPVLVAYTGQYYFSPDHIFILARWGDELETFATLLKRAIAAKREALIQQAESMLGKVRSMTDAEMIVAGAGAEVKL